MKSNDIDVGKFEQIAYLLKSIAHPLRIRIVELLGKYNQLCVIELEELLDAEQSLLSHHLNIMKLKGILSSQRKGKKMYYRLRTPEIFKMLDCLGQCRLDL